MAEHELAPGAAGGPAPETGEDAAALRARVERLERTVAQLRSGIAVDDAQSPSEAGWCAAG